MTLKVTVFPVVLVPPTAKVATKFAVSPIVNVSVAPPLVEAVNVLGVLAYIAGIGIVLAGGGLLLGALPNLAAAQAVFGFTGGTAVASEAVAAAGTNPIMSSALVQAGIMKFGQFTLQGAINMVGRQFIAHLYSIQGPQGTGAGIAGILALLKLSAAAGNSNSQTVYIYNVQQQGNLLSSVIAQFTAAGYTYLGQSGMNNAITTFVK